jgi:hypothetical protein
MLKCALVGGLKDESNMNSVFAGEVTDAVLRTRRNEALEATKDDRAVRREGRDAIISVTISGIVDLLFLIYLYRTVVVASRFHQRAKPAPKPYLCHSIYADTIPP